MTSDINLFGGKTIPHHARIEIIWSALFPLRREVTYFLWSSIVHNPLGPFRREYLNSKSQLRWEKLKCPFSEAAPNLRYDPTIEWNCIRRKSCSKIISRESTMYGWFIYGWIWSGRGKWSKISIFKIFFGALLWPNGLTFSTVLKRFCPLDSKNVLESELELFKV